ncbi:unnamed protein product, partial [Phaeothamnion confervicola]
MRICLPESSRRFLRFFLWVGHAKRFKRLLVQRWLELCSPRMTAGCSFSSPKRNAGGTRMRDKVPVQLLFYRGPDPAQMWSPFPSQCYLKMLSTKPLSRLTRENRSSDSPAL